MVRREGYQLWDATAVLYTAMKQGMPLLHWCHTLLPEGLINAIILFLPHSLCLTGLSMTTYPLEVGYTSNHSFHTGSKTIQIAHECRDQTPSCLFLRFSPFLGALPEAPVTIATIQISTVHPFRVQPNKSGSVLGSAKITFIPFMFLKLNMVSDAF